MKTKYSHISERERRRIEALTQAGSLNKEIAVVLGKSASTISECWPEARCYDCNEPRSWLRSDGRIQKNRR